VVEGREHEAARRLDLGDRHLLRGLAAEHLARLAKARADGHRAGREERDLRDGRDRAWPTLDVGDCSEDDLRRGVDQGFHAHAHE
jgi:hypothetical protein